MVEQMDIREPGMKKELEQQALEAERSAGVLMTTLRRFVRNKAGIVGLCVFGFVVSMALLGPQIAPNDPRQVNLMDHYLAPGEDPQFPLGTDALGRCLYSRLLYGAQRSLVVGLVAVSIGGTIGTIYGAISAYAGGLLDMGLMRVVDIFLSLPFYPIVIILVTLYPEGGLIMIGLAIAFVGWTGYARLVRSEILSLKERQFAEAARGLGASNFRVITRHMLPNAIAPIIVAATFGMAAAILIEAGVSFLGFGNPTIPSWGRICSEGMDVMRKAWWITTLPGIMIFITVLGFNLLGDGIRDSLDPRLKR
ncbi:MAG: ABC transporter permease [Candidatus Methanofastidiosia archaeon]|jgi:peptide/nickel transport system permease protein